MSRLKQSKLTKLSSQVQDSLNLSYKSSNQLNRLIDNHLPSRPRFERHEIVVAGEAFEVYFRDILQCVRALYSDPEFAHILVFAPERHYADADKTVRLYHDMHTGKWWWETQVSQVPPSRELGVRCLSIIRR